MKRFLKSAVFVLATVYFIVDAVFLTIATPLARWMARQRVFVRFRKWIGSLRPYPSLALFAVPLIILEPVKPVFTPLDMTDTLPSPTPALVMSEPERPAAPLQVITVAPPPSSVIVVAEPPPPAGQKQRPAKAKPTK